ncbi:MAG TPA: hypothetical protein H9669_08070 [Firmicutes bacterium]|nr:hypothetical protein [Bacillota bacterium]
MTVISGPFVDEIVSMMIKSNGICSAASIRCGDIVSAKKNWGIFLDNGHVVFYDETKKFLCLQNLKVFSGDAGNLLIHSFPNDFDTEGKTTVTRDDGSTYVFDGKEVFGEQVKNYRCYSLEDTARRAQAPLVPKRQWPGNAAFALWCKTGILSDKAEEIFQMLGKWFPSVPYHRK